MTATGHPGARGSALDRLVADALESGASLHATLQRVANELVRHLDAREAEIRVDHLEGVLRLRTRAEQPAPETRAAAAAAAATTTTTTTTTTTSVLVELDRLHDQHTTLWLAGVDGDGCDVEAREQLRRTLAPLRHLTRQAVLARRLELAEARAREVAHDLADALTVIGGCAEEILRSGAEATVAADARLILDWVGHATAVARRSSDHAHPIDVPALADDVAALFEPTLPSGIRLETRIDRDAPTVDGDPVALRQALLQLLTNAREAIAPGAGRITLAVGPAAGPTDAPAVEMTVRDTGVGIAPGLLRRIFDSGFTTKSTGTGLGLTAARRTIRRHGGEIEAVGAPGSGAQLTIRIPAAARDEDPPGHGPCHGVGFPTDAGPGGCTAASHGTRAAGEAA